MDITELAAEQKSLLTKDIKLGKLIEEKNMAFTTCFYTNVNLLNHPCKGQLVAVSFG